MSLEEIKTAVAGMSRKEQDQLAAFLVHLRHKQDSAIRADIAAKIDDKDSAHWVSLNELKEKWKEEGTRPCNVTGGTSKGRDP